jgi:hypothetical protein
MRQGRLVADLPTAELRVLLRSTQYQIRVKGQLGSQWSEWFDGLTVLPAGGDETILRGTIVDQAALHGLIGKVRDLALPYSARSYRRRLRWRWPKTLIRRPHCRRAHDIDTRRNSPQSYPRTTARRDRLIHWGLGGLCPSILF